MTAIVAIVISPGRSPEPRSSHTAEMIAHNMFVYGGVHGDGAIGEMLVLDTLNALWGRPRTSAPPRPRGNHASAVVGDRLIIFGGSTGGTFYSDCAVLDTTSRSITAPLPATLSRAVASSAAHLR